MKEPICPTCGESDDFEDNADRTMLVCRTCRAWSGELYPDDPAGPYQDTIMLGERVDPDTVSAEEIAI